MPLHFSLNEEQNRALLGVLYSAPIVIPVVSICTKLSTYFCYADYYKGCYMVAAAVSRSCGLVIDKCC